MQAGSNRLGEVLFEEGLVKRDQIQKALDIQKDDSRKLGQVLVDNGWLDESVLTEVLARIFQIPFVEISNLSVDEKVFKTFSSELMKNYHVFPISVRDRFLTLATNDPLNVHVLQEIQYKSGYHINPVMAGLKDIEQYLEKYSRIITENEPHHQSVVEVIDEAPIIQLVNSLITKAIDQKASDIHLEPSGKNVRVRFRIDGVLYEKEKIEKDDERKVLSRIKIMAGLDVAESRRPQDGRISIFHQNGEYDLRVSTLPDIMGENLVLRILSKKFLGQSFEDLGMSSLEVGMVKKLAAKPYGMILATGPTGAGKTTTLYSMLNRLNEIARCIITVEDPVEYEMPGISQTPINVRAGYTFAAAIRHILRHDPDIIMVGEIRDSETAQIAIRSALTGHLVLSTVHTNNAVGAVTRLMDMNIEPFLISSSISGVIAQRLVRRLCLSCKKEYTPEAEVLRSINKFFPIKSGTRFAKPVGCEKCLQTGYQGRVGVYEMLEITEKIRSLILKSASEKEILQAALGEGMKTLQQSGLDKVVSKISAFDEVVRNTFIE